MQGIVEFARQAAALARTERAARQAAMRPVRVYRSVHRRNNNRHAAVIWIPRARRALWLGSYDTPEEAAYAYDAVARLLRGSRARTNFPEPEPSVPQAAAEDMVFTDLALAPPVCRRACEEHEARHLRQQPAPAPATQQDSNYASWLMPASTVATEPAQHQQRAPTALFRHQRPVPPFTQFFHLADPASATTAAAYGAAAAANPALPGAYVLTARNVSMPPPPPPTNPASSALSSTKPVVDVSQPRSAAAPTQHLELPIVPQANLSDDQDQAVVGDNFTDGGASSSVAPPPVPPLTLMDKLEVNLSLFRPGGGPGGAQ